MKNEILKEGFAEDSYPKTQDGNARTITKFFKSEQSWTYSLDTLKTMLQDNDEAMNQIRHIEGGVQKTGDILQEMQQFIQAYKSYVALDKERTAINKEVFGADGDSRDSVDGHLKRLYDEAVNAGAIMTPAVIEVGNKLTTVVNVLSKNRTRSAPEFLTALLDYFDDNTSMGTRITAEINKIYDVLSNKGSNSVYKPKVKEVDPKAFNESILSNSWTWIKRTARSLGRSLSRMAMGFADNAQVLAALDTAIGSRGVRENKTLTFAEFLER